MREEEKMEVRAQDADAHATRHQAMDEEEKNEVRAQNADSNILYRQNMSPEDYDTYRIEHNERYAIAQERSTRSVMDEEMKN